MENAQKAIMVGVGLFITIIIISAVMLISSAGQDVIDNSMTELNNLSDSLSRQLYSDFAYSYLSGSEVIAAVKKYAGSNVAVTVVDTTKSLNQTYNPSNAGKVATDVVSTGKYLSEVTLDADKKYVTAIKFTRQ